MKISLLALTTTATLAACGGPKLGISETQMMAAPARAVDCPLEMQQVDPTSITFNSTWDVLGYVTLFDSKAQDPMAAENRELVRSRACKMGGTVVAVALNMTGQMATGFGPRTGSGLTYMVLRPKSAPAAPTAF
jgi:hypothetical protein